MRIEIGKIEINWSAELADRAVAIVVTATNNKAVFTAPMITGSVIGPS
jgi:hypothetical protein